MQSEKAGSSERVAGRARMSEQACAVEGACWWMRVFARLCYDWCMYDLTSTWAFIKKHDRFIQNVLIGVLLFLMGWHFGRLMSPYYSSHQIVFEDRECSACSPSGGSQEALEELQREGIAQRKSAPSVAGVATVDEGALFVASVNSDLFHHATCSSVSRIKEENQVWFSTVGEAQNAGYEPSKCTIEKLGL